MLKSLILSMAVLSLTSCSSMLKSAPPARGLSSESTTNGPQEMVEASTDITAFVDNYQEGPINEPVYVTNIEEFEEVFGKLSTKAGSDNRANLQVRQFFQNGGSRAWINRIAPPDWIGNAESKTGIYALNGYFDILVLPGLATLKESEAKKFRQAALAFVTQQRAFLIVDPPAGLDYDALIKWRDGATELIEQSHAAAYFPRIQVEDPASGSKGRFLEASGSMAGIMARTLAWKAPANTGIVGAKDVEYKIDEKKNKELNSPVNGVAINTIRILPNYGLGLLVWGARTFHGNSSDFRNIQARRTSSLVEHSVGTAFRSYLLEPQTAATWSVIKSATTNFLTYLWKLGVLVGETPADSFTVDIGLGTTMTAEDILAGRISLLVKIAVSRPSEFIVLTFDDKMQNK